MSGKKFRFSLQRVWEWRQHETQQAEQHLVRARSRRQAQEKRVADARAKLQHVTHDASPDGTSRPRALRQQEAFRFDARRRLKDAKAELERRRRKEDEARRLLREKRREEESLETLYEQEKSRHKKEEADAESAFMDEQAVMRFGRSNHSSLL